MINDPYFKRSRWDMFSREEVDTWPRFNSRKDVNVELLRAWQKEHFDKRWIYILDWTKRESTGFAIDDPVLAVDFILRFG